MSCKQTILLRAHEGEILAPKNIENSNALGQSWLSLLSEKAQKREWFQIPGRVAATSFSAGQTMSSELQATVQWELGIRVYSFLLVESDFQPPPNAVVPRYSLLIPSGICGESRNQRILNDEAFSFAGWWCDSHEF